MAQGLIMLAALAEAPSTVLGTYVVQLSASCNSTSRAANASGLHRNLHTHGIHAHRHKHIK